MTYGVFGNTEVDQLYRKAGLLGDTTLAEFTKALGHCRCNMIPARNGTTACP